MENIRNNITIFEKTPLIFGVDLGLGDDRIDATWFNPIIKKKIENLKKHQSKNKKITTLKRIAKVGGGKRLPKGTVIAENEFNTIPYIRGTDVNDLKIDIKSAGKINKQTHKEIQNYQLKKDDLVITIVGTIGKVGILKEKVEVCNFSENVARIRVDDKNVSQLYLLHFLDSELGKIQTKRLEVGSLQYKLSLNSCRDLNIYLPTEDNSFDKGNQNKILNETYKIIKKADNQYLKSKKLIEEARNVVEKKIKINLESINSIPTTFEVNLKNDFCRIDALFNNPKRDELLKILKKHPNDILGNIIKPQKTGKIIPSDYYNLVDLEQIDEHTGRITNTIEVSELGSKKILLTKNSILISKLQPESGKIVIIDEEKDGCVGSSELISIKLDSEKVLLEYLWIILRSNYVLKQWEYELTGSSRMRIGWNEINNTIIPIVNLKTQKEIILETKEKIKKSDQALKEAKKLYSKARSKFVELVTK